MLVGLVSDTHGVWDPALASHLAGADVILHAGDVGNHGGHAAVLARLRQVCPTVHAVLGNVDDDEAAKRDLPELLLVTLAGWSVLLIHVLADAAAAIQRHQPDIVVCGHSHLFSVEEAAAPQGGQLLRINPGSTGPARFKLKRTAALLTLPPKESGERPSVQRIELAPKAPPRLPEASRPRPKQQARAPAAAAHSGRRQKPSSTHGQGSTCKRPKLR